MEQRIVVGISGGSGAILGIRLLESLRGSVWQTHLVMTETAEELIESETPLTADEVRELATVSYDNTDLFASIASGSFKTAGMVVVPCSMKTLGGIASGYSDNLLLRAADVCLKERRKVVLVARETPLSLIHIENMGKVTRAGAVVFPPVLPFYCQPKGIDDMVNHIVGRVLDVFGIDNELYTRWE
jgi:polyprenyl P-hydroxybenzoate/phenylacrylic acid decarboxylase-like protein